MISGIRDAWAPRALPSVARAVTLATNFAFNVLVARLVGARSAGDFFSAVVITTLLSIIARMGSDLYALKHAAPHAGELNSQWFSLRWLVRLCVTASLTVLAFALLLAAGLAAAFPHGDLGAVLAVQALSIPFQCFAVVQSAVLRSAGRGGAGAFAELGLTQVLAGLSLLAWSTQATVDPILVSWFVSGASVLTAIWARSQVRHLPHAFTERVTQPRPPLRELLGEMIRMAAAGLLFYLMTWLPVVSLWALSSSEQAAFFAAGVRFSGTLSVIPTIQMTAVIPEVALRAKRGEVDAINTLLRAVARRASVVAVPAAIIMIVGAGPLIHIYGSEFGPAARTMRVLAAAQAIVVVLGFANPIKSVVGEERAALLYVAGALALGIPAVLIASRMAGAFGASIAYAALTIGYAVVSAAVLKHQTGIVTYLTLHRRVRNASDARAIR